MSNKQPEQKQGEIMVVQPNVEAAKSAMDAFQALKAKLLDANDIVEIQNKKYIKRSGWRKIALAFNISTEIVSIEREKIGDVYVVRVKARAIAPNGRVSEEVGVCDSSEFSGNLKPTFHNIEAKAVTRAINRAISNLVGGGELSAEEVIQGADEPPQQNSATQQNGIVLDDGAVVKNALDMLIEKIQWHKNPDGSRWAFIKNRDGSISPEVQALLNLINANPEGYYVHNGKEYTADDKYLRERSIEKKDDGS